MIHQGGCNVGSARGCIPRTAFLGGAGAASSPQRPPSVYCSAACGSQTPTQHDVATALDDSRLALTPPLLRHTAPTAGPDFRTLQHHFGCESFL